MEKKLGTDQFAGLAAVVIAEMPRDLAPEVAQAWMEGGGRLALRDALDRALRQGPPPSVDPDAWVDTLDLAKIERRVFEIVVDPNLTIEQMVAASEYNYADPNHTTAVFGACRKVTGTKPVKAKVVAFCVGRNATRKQAIRLRSRLNLGAICIQHELALGAQHKNAQRDLNWIVNADDEVLVHGVRVVSYLDGGPGDRDLGLYGAGLGWRADAWFLGLLSE
ncbi:hypothetical protein HY477_02480 [Candidatus Uhrbacteria bacterium]|nr:hypothetical protein [Candidatus Uhrbacteria bacterium]